MARRRRRRSKSSRYLYDAINDADLDGCGTLLAAVFVAGPLILIGLLGLAVALVIAFPGVLFCLFPILILISLPSVLGDLTKL